MVVDACMRGVIEAASAMAKSREAFLLMRFRIENSLRTFDLRSYENYDGRAAVVAAGFSWPLDAVSHPAV
jgi:hypothetical protein